MFNMFKTSKTTDEIEKELFDICKKGTLFGSRSWGGYTKHSDYDILVDGSLFIEISSFCKRHDLKYDRKISDNYTSLPLALDKMLNIFINDKHIQIAKPEKRDYIDFKFAIGIMDHYATTHSMTEKKNRVKAFDKIQKFTEKRNNKDYIEISQFAEKHCPEYLI